MGVPRGWWPCSARLGVLRSCRGHLCTPPKCGWADAYMDKSVSRRKRVGAALKGEFCGQSAGFVSQVPDSTQNFAPDLLCPLGKAATPSQPRLTHV